MLALNNNYVVIMAGGVGTRFWPFSRSTNPKQFHDVLGTGRTLLQQTADRFEGVCPKQNIYVVTSAEYVELVKAQLPFLTSDQILAEPARRNTAPCIAYSAYKIAARNPLANIVVAPADHIILKEEAFKERVHTALAATATQNQIVTLGITPTRPDTGYGYIQFVPQSDQVKKVVEFKEKPNLSVAQKFVESGEYVWNAGIFVWNVATIKKAFEAFLPKVAAIFESGTPYYYTPNEANYMAESYKNCEAVSIDNGVMEHAQNVSVVLSDIGWSDLGTWKSLYEVSNKDENQNVVDGRVILQNSHNCIVKTPQERLVVVQGLDGYIVAEYDNVLLICRKDEEQRVKDFVSQASKIGATFA
jgi:mannose-1-phosphate guanylyltransferase